MINLDTVLNFFIGVVSLVMTLHFVDISHTFLMIDVVAIFFLLFWGTRMYIFDIDKLKNPPSRSNEFHLFKGMHNYHKTKNDG